MSLFSSILPCLLAAFALGALLGWALKSLLGDRKLIDLEADWATRLRRKESEWQTSNDGLRVQLNTLQANFTASTASIRAHEDALADWNTKYDVLAADLATKTADFEQVKGGLEADLQASSGALELANQAQAKLHARVNELEAVSGQVKDWEAKYLTVVQEKDTAVNRLQTRVSELEPLTLQAKDWELRFLQVSGDKETEVKELQRQISELEPLRAQAQDWELKYTAVLQERETETAKLRNRITELEPLSVQVNDWQTKYQATVTEKDAAINSLRTQLSAAGAAAPIASVSPAASTAPPSAKEDLLEIEGIGDHYFGKLKAIGLTLQSQMLAQGATKKGRVEIAQKSGIAESLILRWVNHIDLIRINGIGPQYAELLEAAGVDSVPELAQRNAENLQAKLVEVNNARNLVGRVASVSEVTDWIQQAKGLPRVVTH